MKKKALIKLFSIGFITVASAATIGSCVTTIRNNHETRTSQTNVLAQSSLINQSANLQTKIEDTTGYNSTIDANTIASLKGKTATDAANSINKQFIFDNRYNIFTGPLELTSSNQVTDPEVKIISKNEIEVRGWLDPKTTYSGGRLEESPMFFSFKFINLKVASKTEIKSSILNASDLGLNGMTVDEAQKLIDEELIFKNIDKIVTSHNINELKDIKFSSLPKPIDEKTIEVGLTFMPNSTINENGEPRKEEWGDHTLTINGFGLNANISSKQSNSNKVGLGLGLGLGLPIGIMLIITLIVIIRKNNSNNVID